MGRSASVKVRGMSISQLRLSIFSVTLLAVLVWISPARAMTLGDIEIPPDIQVGEQTLVLNGAGMREKMFVDAYVACLYLAERDGDPDHIMTADDPQAIVLHVTSGWVTTERLAKGLVKDLKKATEGNMAPIRSQTNRLLEMLAAREIAKGDMIKLAYQPDEGLEIWHNERRLGVVKGVEFKQALFGIWLSDRPTQNSLKLRMLDLEAAVEAAG